MTPRDVKAHLLALFDDLLAHDGFGDLRLEIRILKRGQKEVLIYCGKQYRYVIDVRPTKRLADESVNADRQNGGHKL
jgi:hypothetical protein